MRDWPEDELQRARQILVGAVARICPARLSDRRDDIVQNALIRVMKVADEKGSDLPGTSYLWRAAHSATVDEIRSTQRRREAPLDEGEQVRLPTADPELKRTVLRELARLRPPRRVAVLLQLHGFSVAESADILGWSTKRVENHRYLGIGDLRRALRESGVER